MMYWKELGAPCCAVRTAGEQVLVISHQSSDVTLILRAGDMGTVS